MAGITLAQAEAKLDEYLTAESKVLLGQEYRIGDRSLTRADLSAIRDGIEIWDRRVKMLTDSASGRSRATNLCPRW